MRFQSLANYHILFLGLISSLIPRESPAGPQDWKPSAVGSQNSYTRLLSLKPDDFKGLQGTSAEGTLPIRLTDVRIQDLLSRFRFLADYRKQITNCPPKDSPSLSYFAQFLDEYALFLVESFQKKSVAAKGINDFNFLIDEYLRNKERRFSKNESDSKLGVGLSVTWASLTVSPVTSSAILLLEEIKKNPEKMPNIAHALILLETTDKKACIVTIPTSP